jgi:APA family basic amino acid/polyamine antiporter
MIVIGLISTLSANIMAGPRVYEAVGRDYPDLEMPHDPPRRGPIVAILLQACVAATIMVTASFDSLLKYVGVSASMVAG